MKLHPGLILSVLLVSAGGQAAEAPAPKPAEAARLSAQKAEAAEEARAAVRRQHG
ncbi:MAG: hypothetical protein ACK4SR_10465 [Thiobacillus sp.]